MIVIVKKRKVIALIPARNEADSISDTIKSIKAQTRQVNEIIVVANNCTDNTAEISKKSGAIVFNMQKNDHMKAGALNYALDKIVPYIDEQDCILIMDADTIISKDLVEKCLREFDKSPRIGAVGSVFLGRPAKTLLGKLQIMEYWRYKRQIRRNGNRAFVLTGTASVFLAKTLRAVKDARNDGSLPYGGGSYYDILGRTEDNEMTLAVLTLGYDCPVADAFTKTDVMDMPNKLVKQRERWYNGALVNLKAYGLSLPWFLRWVYWKQQIGLFISIITFLFFNAVFIICICMFGKLYITPYWLIPLGVLLLERTATVWSLGWKARLIALSLIPEQIYSMFLLLIYGLAFLNFARGKNGKWHAT